MGAYFPKMIKQKRLELGENQTQFGKRFNVSATAVSLWESGKRQAPYEVLEFVIRRTGEKDVSDTCGKAYEKNSHHQFLPPVNEVY